MLIDPRVVHEAMQYAPQDGKDYRQARAAIKAVLDWLTQMTEGERQAAYTAHVLT